MMKTPRVFVSMGAPYTEEYVRFRDELERFLRDQCHVDPRIIGKNEYPTGTPIRKIADVMKTCDGVIIVAYERKLIATGVEKRGGKDEHRIENATFTTPWNHIESALAFSFGLPMYMIAQRGLTEEGLIESKIDWYVQKIDFNVQSLQRPEVSESIVTWVRERVAVPARKSRAPFESLLKLKLSEITLGEWFILGGAFATTFATGLAIGEWLHS